MASQRELRNTLARIVGIVALAAGTCACSSVPDWVNPTNWIGGNDQDANQDSDSDNAPTPDLASIPNKPAPPSTPDDQKKVSDSLAADRAAAQYSAEALQGGSEPGAAAPPASPPPDQGVSSVPTAAGSAGTDQSSTEQASAAPTEEGSATGSAAPAAPAPAASAPQPAAEVASTEPAPPVAAPLPAVPAAPTEPVSDAQLGFEASKAPALDPSVSRYVPRAILDKIQKSSGSPPAAPDPPVTRNSNQSSANDRFLKTPSTDSRLASGSEPAASRLRSKADIAPRVTPASYSPDDQARRIGTAYFPSDAAKLTGQAAAAVRAAAETFAAAGGIGFIRVVGHSSNHASVGPIARRLEIIFQRSHDYAATVAQELIRDGVPAEKVLVEAVGDSEPLSSPPLRKGEAGSRRAEIFM